MIRDGDARSRRAMPDQASSNATRKTQLTTFWVSGDVPKRPKLQVSEWQFALPQAYSRHRPNIGSQGPSRCGMSLRGFRRSLLLPACRAEVDIVATLPVQASPSAKIRHLCGSWESPQVWTRARRHCEPRSGRTWHAEQQKQQTDSNLAGRPMDGPPERTAAHPEARGSSSSPRASLRRCRSTSRPSSSVVGPRSRGPTAARTPRRAARRTAPRRAPRRRRPCATSRIAMSQRARPRPHALRYRGKIHGATPRSRN